MLHHSLSYFFINYLLRLVPKFLLFSYVDKSEIVFVTKSNAIYSFLFFLKKHTNSLVNIIMDICAVDYPQKYLRFEVVYNTLSFKYNYRLRIKSQIDEINALASVSVLFLSANWWEREIWDMFGIFFYNHNRLRRILTDYGFIGYPLRKDFPNVGFYEVRYSEVLQKVVYEPVEFSAYNRFY